ncbi:MAG: Yip1 family protein [Gammaproteobacteria bacterium]|nr:Yip1 family protein [Gammaproteobacteria bacterium]MCY4357311.1 Yip1 family protein [Gammaproteobacteria bacterium]
MATSLQSTLIVRVLYDPTLAFNELAKSESGPVSIFFRYSLWLLLMPPFFSFIGAASSGWSVGPDEPLFLGTQSLLLVSVGYFLILNFGLLSTAIISNWMASTYGAEANMGKHVGLITIVGEPLAIASIAHLSPDVLLNMLVLIPTMIWSMYLLYKGIPIVFNTPPERGMLMASSLVGWLLVAAVSLLGISMALWTMGVGPLLGV